MKWVLNRHLIIVNEVQANYSYKRLNVSGFKPPTFIEEYLNIFHLFNYAQRRYIVNINYTFLICASY